MRGIGNRQKTPFNRAEGNPPFLSVIMAGILAVKPLRIEKHPHRAFERHAVLGEIFRGLTVVPFKVHS